MSGYIGNIPVPQATQTRQSFTATASQTTFNTAGYSVGYVDVFLNGVKLAPADYTATNGSDIILAVGAASGDILETVAYEIFQVVDQDFTGDFTVDGSTFVVDSVNDRVGVGTASPEKLLDVDGGAIIRGRLTLGDTTEYAGGTLYQSGGNTILRAGSTADSITLYNSGSSVTYAQFAPTYSYFSQNVGIGTSSPSNPFEVIGSTDANIATFSTLGDGGGASNRGLSIAADTYGGSIRTVGSSVSMGFDVNGSERMRIDSSGNLLVGMSSYSAASAGTTMQSGLLTSARSGNIAAYFNRLSSDGSIVSFAKDGSTVGSIGSRSGRADIEINTTLGSGRLNAAGTGVMGWNNVPEVFPHTDNSTNLGSNTNRWNNLYLSGGVYLGGTGSANQLDDYEEGTWTPTVTGSTGGSATLTDASGAYTKIGRMVTVTAEIDINSTNTATGTIRFSNLPFTVANLLSPTGIEAVGVVSFWSSFSTGVNSLGVGAVDGSTYMELYGLTSSTATVTSNISVSAMGNGEVRVTCTYFTT